MTPEQERDKEVTDAIVEVIGALKGALRGFGHLCEAGADYLEAKNRSRFFDRGPYPPKDPSMRQKAPVRAVKQMPPSKN